MSESEAEWYYARDNQQYGPVGAEVVRDLLARGELRGTDLVWRNGMANWEPAAHVPELSAGTQGYPQQPTGGAAPVPPQPGWGGPAMPQPPQPPPGYGYGQPPVGGGMPPGTPLGYGTPETSQKGKAIGALVCSILGLGCCGLVLGIVAIALSSSAQKEMQRTGNFEGQGLAKAAFIIGIIDVIAWAIGLFIGFSARSGGGFNPGF